jgi:hypothetical protein
VAVYSLFTIHYYTPVHMNFLLQYLIFSPPKIMIFRSGTPCIASNGMVFVVAEGGVEVSQCIISKGGSCVILKLATTPCGDGSNRILLPRASLQLVHYYNKSQH